MSKHLSLIEAHPGDRLEQSLSLILEERLECQH